MNGVKFTPHKKTLISQAFEKALYAQSEQILGDCNYFVRVDQGTLRDTAKTEKRSGAISLVWNQDYAKRVYYTGTPSHDVNPNASLMWAQKAADKYGEDWAAIIGKAMFR